ncbi:MAG: hypothetical protein D6748_01410 [Calditrichaeota bacterium]|nr:MAG: hypothetical protein D6748_01410 [Calditrichota bacterium]
MILFILFFSCSNPSKVDVENRQNILTYEDKYGIISFLKYDNNNVSLNDTVRITLLTINNSDTHEIHIQTSSGPLWHYDIYNQDMELIESLPRWSTPTLYDFYFSPGDTFKSTLNWAQTQYSNDRYSDLKVFSGDYYITGRQLGLPPGKVGIWIHISEEGEPLSTKLYWHTSNHDSIKLDFLIRNRISNELTFKLKADTSPKIQFFDSIEDTLVKEINLDVNFSTIRLPPKSDSNILSFAESTSFLKSIGLSGIFNCRIVLSCEERDIIAKRSIVIN